MKLSLIVAMAENRVIGRNNELPWRISDDLKHFKALTTGKPIIMGRKTWESLPRKPLPNRVNIVMTRDPGFAAEGATVVHNLDQAIAAAENTGTAEAMVIGGEEIYKLALGRATKIYLTEVHQPFAGDAFFPEINGKWAETERDSHPQKDDRPAYSFVTYER